MPYYHFHVIISRPTFLLTPGQDQEGLRERQFSHISPSKEELSYEVAKKSNLSWTEQPSWQMGCQMKKEKDGHWKIENGNGICEKPLLMTKDEGDQIVIVLCTPLDFWSSREIRDKERPLNVDSTFKRLSRRLLHCRSLVKIHARSNCEGYPSMGNIHQQSWATTLCPFSLRGKHTQRGLIHFLAHSRVFIHTITYHMVTPCIQICHPCLQSCQRTTYNTHLDFETTS